MSKPKKSQRIKDAHYVASVAVFNEDGLLLFGKRADVKKWCLPGGKFEVSEAPSQAATRELWEETALTPHDGLEFIGDAFVPRANVYVFSFKVTIKDQEPDAGLDPDAEFVEFQWVEPNNIPENILNNLYNKEDVTLQKLGLQEVTLKSEGSYWHTPDLRIPHNTNPKRLIWNEAYLAKVQEIFVKNEEAFEIHDIDITKVPGYNTPINKERVKLYRRMLKAGEELPPVVVRYDEHGFSLLDGNHRQEACIQTGITNVKAIIVHSTKLNKGIGLVTLMGALAMGGASTPKPTAHSIEQGQGLKTWTPEGLDKDLYPIAHLESSWGQNMNHGKNSAGEYHTAYGALGFKPSTAHERYKKSPLMQKQFPGLTDPADFLKTFKNNPKFYNQLATEHFNYLKGRHGAPEEAARAWRYGSTAVMKQVPDVMADKEGYVSKYKALIDKVTHAK